MILISDRSEIENVLKNVIEYGFVLEETHFPELGLPDTSTLIRGKVRNTYFHSPEEALTIVTDRISAGDVNMGTGMPMKGRILAEQAETMFKLVEDVSPNHLIERVHPNCFRIKRAKQHDIEFVVRGYVTGSAWDDIQDGSFKEKYGFDITSDMVVDEKLRKDCKLKEPILTPTGRAKKLGEHDEPLTREQAIKVFGGDGKRYAENELCCIRMYEKAAEFLEKQGIILPDTKFERGVVDEKDIATDELFTSDSSRFWPAGEYQKRLEAGEEQIYLDKQVLRNWLKENGLWQVPGVIVPVPVRIKTMKGYLEALRRMVRWSEGDLEKNVSDWFGDMKASGDPEKAIYKTLLDKGILNGYCAVVIAGSGSDLKAKDGKPDKLFSTLEDLKVPYSVTVVSAHKDGDRHRELVKWCDKYPGDVVFIDRTGLSNGKGPSTAGMTKRSVLFEYDRGLDVANVDLFSSVDLPSGVPLMVCPGGENTALAAAKILAYSHRELYKGIEEYMESQKQKGLDDAGNYGRVWGP